MSKRTLGKTGLQVSELFLQKMLAAGIWYKVGHPWPVQSIADSFRALWDRTAVKALITLTA